MLGSNNVGQLRSSQRNDGPSRRDSASSLAKMAKDTLKRGKGGGGKGGGGQTPPQNVTKTKSVAVAVAAQSVEPRDLLENFAEKLAESKVFRDQMEFQGQIDSKFGAEIDQLFGSEYKDRTSDSVVLTTSASVHNQGELRKSNSKDGVGDLRGRDVEDDTVLAQVEKRLAETAKSGQSSSPLISSGHSPNSEQSNRLNETMKQFVSAYSEDLILQKPEKKKAVSELRERLQTLGMSNKKISEMQSKVSAFVQKDFRDRVKKGFVQFALSYGSKMTNELMVCNKQFKALEEMGLGTGILTDDADVKELKDAAKQEMMPFIADELDNALIQSKASGSSFKELISEFNKFNELASVIKFDAGSYMMTLGKKMDQLGLTYFVPPDGNRGFLDTDSQGGQKKNAPVELELDPGVLGDQLRRLVIQRSVRTDIIGAIEVRYKIARLRAKLKKSGVSDTELADIETEGEALARVKFSDLVRESFEERAALPDLSGPAFDLVRKKLKKALKGLKALNAPISKKELNDMRDQINKGMFTVVKEEFLKVDAVSENMPSNKSLASKRKQLLRILERLKKESSILEDINADPARVLDRPDVSVIEAA